MTTYRTIVIDPPWPQKGAGALVGRMGFEDATGASKPMPYRTLSVAEIATLRVRELADPGGCHLYLWATNRFLPDAYTVLRGWGFTYSTTIVWAKRIMGGGMGGAYGISTEYIVFGRRGSLPALSKVPGTWFTWKRPYDGRGKPLHSAKPGEFFTMVETVSPGPRLEMFARQPRLGWDVWGDQAPSSVELPVLGGAAYHRERSLSRYRDGVITGTPMRGRGDRSTPAERDAYLRALELLAQAHPLEFRTLLDGELAGIDTETTTHQLIGETA